MWVEEILHGNPVNVVEMFRMPREVFYRLAETITDIGGLRSTLNVSVEEQLAIFLYFCGHHASNRALQNRFQHSGDTISRHLRSVLNALRRMSPILIKIPDENASVHDRILSSSKFYPFFEGCRMCIDGTHVPVSVPAADVARFQSRKGITMNVLAACDFDLLFTYVLAGWEGTAGDGKLYEAALQSGLSVPL
ncbi:hypothetical protein Ae201684P_007741 [Aphanomyces euteiches]|uniref:DDE Tnp4 domain-containing protein n=1 Tax=Aphanomyces euteiches TaxID=100861 RepID=A0A6G0XSR5_9STRA|nr:hypothetical protein Ae201684_001915 [Aphanomyces euteiches]KAH9089573.1 hypothetical protein Ae201684P_007741 [Aphanomyces euteiches]